MNIIVGHLYSYDHRITMWVVYPSGVCFYEDNVFKLFLGTLHWALICPMYMSEKGILRFLGIPIARVSTLPYNMWSSKDCQDFLILSRLCCLGCLFTTMTCGSFSKNSLKWHARINLFISSLIAVYFTIL